MTKVMIDPGHGGADPGAVARSFAIREKDLTLAISKRIGATLEENYDVQVFYTRTTDTTMNLAERTALANKHNVDYLLSVHINAGGGTGYEDFIYVNLSDSSQSAKIRDVVHAEIVPVLKKFGVKDRGKKKANFHMLRESKMPAMLSENLFIDNPADQKLLSNTAFLNELSDAHAHGIAKALGLKKRTVPKQIKKEDCCPKYKIHPYRVIADGKTVSTNQDISYLLRNVEKAVDAGAKEIRIERVK